jgi:two-component system chemotaxis response regulator CheB
MNFQSSRRHQPDIMKRKMIRLSQDYVAALRMHLLAGLRGSLTAAVELGRQAVALGLETLELARIHERAFATLDLSRCKKGVIKRSEIFFSEAITPIVATHHTARQNRSLMGRLKKTLGRRTEALAASQRQWQRGVVRRKFLEDAAEKNGNHRDKYLKESLQLQKHLRQLTHRVMAAQEDERLKISHELQNEIAQTLLGINVRLIAMQQKARNNVVGLKGDIASTQRLVVKSARSVRQFARELDLRPPAKNAPAVAALRRVVASGSRFQRVSASRLAREKSAGAHPPKKTGSAARMTAPVPPPTSPAFPVIAMAASVGGLKALSVILGNLPPNFPAAIAIVMHLAPDHKSLLAEILNSRSHLVVAEAHDGDQLCPSRVFIAPPNHHLLVAKDGRLKLSSAQAEKIHFARPSAEPLFATVAAVYRQSAIAVVLTGGDGDGSFGVQIIKDKGGMVIAQDRPTSENFSMPETSINTGDVDYILPLDEIAPTLIALVWAGKKQNGRRLVAPVPAKCATPRYAAGGKAVMLKPSHKSA